MASINGKGIRNLKTRITKRGKIAIIIALLLVLAAAVTILLKSKASNAGADGTDMPIETAAVEKMDLVQSLTLSGTVVSGATYSVTSPITEVEIRTVNVHEGDRVRKGDVIAVLDDTQMRAGKKAAQQNLRNTEIRSDMELESAKRNYNNAKEDRDIHAKRNNEEVKRAKADYTKAVNEHSSLVTQHTTALNELNAIRNTINNQPAGTQNPDLQDELEKAEAKVERLTGEVKAAEENKNAAKQNLEKAKQDRADDKLSQSRNVREQKEAVKSAELSAKESVSAPKEELRKAQKDLDECVVVSEIDGVVTSVAVKPGDVYKGDAIAVINDDSSYRVSAKVDQYDISSLADGQEADISVKAADMEDVHGSLIHVAKTPVAASNMDSSSTNAEYQVEAIIDEPNEKLKIGMTAKVVVKVWEKKDCLAVPDNCVQIDENGERYVEVMDDKGNIKQVPVEYGMKTDYYAEISGKGIEEGVNIVVPLADEFDEESEAMY
ncbi:MAG: HlyD family efflux transporter periplasmic adaptor subunit [Mogibacterium sp.]|nr:HlyD family efflux transporter periplasmic adaptor subunit [Mogibacterium sp.]